MQGSSETAATAVSGLSDADEEVQATVGRPRRDPALSERDLTRLRVRAYRARQHSSRILQTAQPQDNALFSNWIDSENQCSAQDNPCSPQNDPTLPVRFHQGDDAQQATSDWRRINSSSSASSTTLTSDFALAPFDTNDHYPIADDHYRSLSPDRSIREDPTFPAADRIQVDLPYLDSFIEALQAQETRSGLDFLESQTTTYDRIFKTLFTAECHCKSVPPPHRVCLIPSSDRRLFQVQVHMRLMIMHGLIAFKKGRGSSKIHYHRSRLSLTSALPMKPPNTFTNGRNFFPMNLLSLYLSTKPKLLWSVVQPMSNGGGTSIVFGLGPRACRLSANPAFSACLLCRRSNAICPRIR